MASHPWQRNLIEARNFQGLCDVDPSIKDKLITRICNSRYSSFKSIFSYLLKRSSDPIKSLCHSHFWRTRDNFGDTKLKFATCSSFIPINKPQNLIFLA